MDRLKVLVLGAGAVGTYIGGSLALTGQSVTFLDRPQVVEELRENGLRLDLRADPRRRSDGQIRLTGQSYPLDFVPSIQDALSRSAFDVGIFALKSFDTSAFIEEIRPFAKDFPPILCLSNGVENEAALAEILGANKVIAGTVTSSVGRKAAGEVVLERLRGVGVVEKHPLSLWLVSALEAAGLNGRMYPRVEDLKWSKMLTNLLANASSAILDMAPAEILADPAVFKLEMAMLRETLAVMRSRGIKVVDTPKTPVKLLALAAHLPAFIARPLMRKAAGSGRGGKMPSFHIDLYAGRGLTEVQWLNGAVDRFGEKHHVRTPVNRMLTDTLLSISSGEIPLAEFAHRPEKLLALAAVRKKGIAS